MMRLVFVLSLVACSQRAEPSAAAAPVVGAANYELDCAPSNTSNAAQLHCVRTDTRSGDVLVVDYMRLPTSTGPTGTGMAPPGRFTTVCDAASTDTRSDFYCIRMNTETGELLLVNLTQVGVLPPRPQ
jgi:hypothetical protein